MDCWTAFILGLVSSAHCAGMCGPLALAMPGAGTSGPRFWAGRLGYNLGRILTYTALGVVFGLVGRTLFLAGLQRWLSVGLGAALLAGLLVSRRLALWRPLTALLERFQPKMSLLLRRSSFGSLVALGLLNGLLPCGLVYVACAGAAATSGILAGARYMAAFGAGTLPVMLAIGLGGRLVPLAWRLKLRQAIPISVCLLGLLLILRGMSLGIPYLSPDLSRGGASCCP
ncbi:MAG TPA: sulfite exporter TauE/SafE family protein [Dongiaceae bacterium]|nr:sulfite exporter TauE/SafE family protein [Dongiaceae bacterium]